MNSEEVEVELEIIVPTEAQTKELFNQLVNRCHSISHESSPRYEDHVNFVNNHPYRAWYIIKQMKKTIGTIYVQYDNSIGLNCNDNVSELQIKKILNVINAKLLALEAVPSVRFGGFFLNVASSNIALQEKLKNIGLRESQRSFFLDKDL
jgi:hypothetical protein